MALIETLTGIDKVSDNYYEVTSNVVVGANIDDVEFSHFRCTTGIIRFGAGCTTKFTRCHFEETDTAISLGFDNFTSDACRWHGGSSNTAIFEGCVWTMADGMSRSDIDIRIDDTAVVFRDYEGARCEFHSRTSGNIAHFAGAGFTLDGLVMNNVVNAKGIEFAVPPTNISNLEVIDNHTGSGTPHVVFLTGQWANNDTFSFKGLKCRSIGTFGGNATMTIQLVDPFGDIRKSQFLTASAEIHRTYKLATIDITQSPVTATQVITFTDDNSLVHDANAQSLELTLLQDTVAGGGTTIVTRNSYRRAIAKYGFVASVRALLVTAQNATAIDDGDILLLEDEDISENDAATVAAYALTTWTAEQLYDAIKLYEVVRTERHLVGDSLASRILESNDLGALNLTFNQSATGNIAVSAGILTVKGTTYSGDIKTSGVVTLPSIAESRTVDGANEINLGTLPTAITVKNSTKGIIIDSVGTYNMEQFTFDSNTKDVTVADNTGAVTILAKGLLDVEEGTGNTVTVVNNDITVNVTTPVGYDNEISLYLTANDADAETNAIGTGSTFEYVSGGSLSGITVYWRMEKLDGSHIVESITTPSTAGTYSIPLVVAPLDVTLATLEAGNTALLQAIADTKAVVDAQETKVQADARQVILIAEHDATQVAVGAISPTVDEASLHSGLDSYSNKGDWQGAGLSEAGLHAGLDSYPNKDDLGGSSSLGNL